MSERGPGPAERKVIMGECYCMWGVRGVNGFSCRWLAGHVQIWSRVVSPVGLGRHDPAASQGPDDPDPGHHLLDYGLLRGKSRGLSPAVKLQLTVMASADDQEIRSSYDSGFRPGGARYR